MATTLAPQKWNDNSTIRKTKDFRQHAFVTYATWALKVERLLVTVKVLKVQGLEEIFIIYDILQNPRLFT